MIYIASPYTHEDPAVRAIRYLRAMRYTAKLLQAKRWCYSPIVHCHPMAFEHKLPTDAMYWLEYNMKMLQRCDELHILKLHGWEKSIGVMVEEAYAITNGIRITKVSDEDI